jgi:Mg-chelatase subunit ChlD
VDAKNREDSDEWWKPILQKLKDHDVILVNAAGNGWWNKDTQKGAHIDAKWSSPAGLEAEYDSLIIVANSQQDARLNDSSNFGKCVTAAAPGTNIYSTVLTGDGSYGQKTGTSMASPFVTGLVALVYSADLQAHPDKKEPTLKPTDVKKLIREGAEARKHSLDGGNFYIVDAAESVRKAGNVHVETEDTATCIVMDVSASMSTPASGHLSGSKLDAAQEAAKKLLGAVNADANAHGVTHQFAAIEFSSTAAVVHQLGDDLTAVQKSISALVPEFNTNMSAGLDLGLQQLGGVSDARKFFILLSDGMPNEGITGDELLNLSRQDNPVAQAAAAGVKIYTVGFGNRAATGTILGPDDGGVDEKLLQGIADATGGSYYYADESFKLQNAYLLIHHQTMGNVLKTYGGTVAQSESKELGTQTIGANTAEIYATCNFPGSQVDLLLDDPAGRAVGADYPGARIVTGCPMSVFVSRPKAGEWKCAVKGTKCPKGPEPFEVVISSRESKEMPPPAAPTGGGGGAMPDNSEQVYLLLTIAGCGLMLALITAVALKRRPARAQVILPPPWMMTIREPGTASRTATIRAAAMRVGRGPGNQLQLADPQVSGAHLQIQRVPQGFLVRDLGSHNGVWVGPRRVIEPVVVPPGTSVRLGNTTLTLNA